MAWLTSLRERLNALRRRRAFETERGHRAGYLIDLDRDLRHAVRDLRDRPGFSAITLITLALCIGANAVIFSLVNTVVLRPLPYPASDRLVSIFNSYPGAGILRAGNSITGYFDRKEQRDLFTGVAGFSVGGGIVGEGEASHHVFTMSVTSSYFETLLAKPFLGRLFTSEDDLRETGQTVVLSHGFWQSEFGGDEAVIGRQFPVGGTPHRIIGILPKDFLVPTWDTDVWTLNRLTTDLHTDDNRFNESSGWDVIARLRNGVTIEQARARVLARNRAILESYDADIRGLLANAGFTTVIRSWQEDLGREVRLPLMILLGGALFLLLIGCVNIANLILVRTTARVRDFATRHALGAGRLRIIQQIVTESILLCVIGGGMGLLLGGVSLRLLHGFEVWEIPMVSTLRLDGPTLGYSLLLVALVGLVTGLVPALRLLKEDLTELFLQGGARFTPGKGALSLRGLLVSIQIAVTFILLMGAGLLLSSLHRVLSVDPGFQAEGLHASAITLPYTGYQDVQGRVAFVDAMIEEIEAIPEVESAAIVSNLPFSEVETEVAITPEGMGWGEDEPIATPYSSVVSPGFFDTMGIPLLAGRGFDRRDGAGSIPVVIIDEWLAGRFWSDRDPIGQRLRLGAGPISDPHWMTIVGVVGSIRQNDLVETTQDGAFYTPHSQHGLLFFRVVARTGIEPREALPMTRAAVQRIDPGLTPFWGAFLEEELERSLIYRRIPMQLLMVFAGMALFLAALGIYGVLAYTVGLRTREIGIRIALGSTAERIIRLIGRQWLRMVWLGLLAGVAGALLLTRVIVSLLYGVTPTDPAVFLGVVAVLGSVALTACLLPAWHATRVNPVRALRAE